MKEILKHLISRFPTGDYKHLYTDDDNTSDDDPTDGDESDCGEKGDAEMDEGDDQDVTLLDDQAIALPECVKQMDASRLRQVAARSRKRDRSKQLA